MRSTSAEVYNRIKDEGLLSKRRWQVYDVLFRRGPLTQNEACQILADETSLSNKPSVTPRFAELEARGVIHVAGKRRCEVTGELCLAYDVTACLPHAPAPRQTPRQKLQTALDQLRDATEQLRLACIERDRLRERLERWGRPTNEERQRRMDFDTKSQPQLLTPSI